ncbi:ABC transporter ATP-binding protein [Burkholderia ubonensis]|uniref:ABC transporter ATP-binding protein n=1 Tax=Burkholderia ubonensis TaxID=101571 RepID=UPI00075BB5EF|nr:ABC transporter ATP-binding protein [Burkholderia ubonensis]KVR64769.1 multidrug ABC transporter ATP-binding protein [Burkholderia ubonensis]
MTRKTTQSGGHAFQAVFGFTLHYWRRQPARIAAVVAFSLLAALGIGATLLRQGVYLNIIALTLKMMGEIATASFRRVQRFSTDWHANSFAGSTVRKITRGMWALDLLNDTLLIALLPSLTILVGATVLLGSHWPMMGLVVGLGSLLYIAVTVAMSLGFVAPAARLGNLWDTRMGGALADAVSCNAVVKAFGAEVREEARLARVIGKWQKRTRRSWMRGTFNGGLQGAMLVAIQAAMIGVALKLWASGAASVGDIAFALTMFFMLQGYLRDIGFHIRNLQRSVNDMEELVALERQPLGIDDKPGAQPIRITRGEIRFEHVTFRYGNHPVALYDDFSMRIAPGERVGLVGHSGSGKTTFIKLIQRLYDVSGGRITIDGQDIADARQDTLRSQIAIVQQEPVLFHRTLAENIAYARPGASRADIERAARQASAHAFIAALPDGYDTLVGERGVKLSGGERQRVAIARAFLADAPILILDEATSSLDSESEVLIQQAMERLMEGRTTLVVAHRLSTVRALDRLLVLDRGKVIEESSHDALIRIDGGLYRRLFERQALELAKGLADTPRGHASDGAEPRGQPAEA